MSSRSELEGWGTWEEDRRYLSRDRTHMIIVSKNSNHNEGCSRLKQTRQQPIARKASWISWRRS
jgi:hypothetical protein